MFDFEALTFETRSARRFFARRNINVRATEEFLNRHIETPFARVQDALRAAAPDLTRMEEAWAQLPATALVGLFWLQMQRVRDANQPRTQYHLDELARHGFAWLEQVTATVFDRFEPILYRTTSALYFPETAHFMVPMVGQMPVMALPIDTGLALVFARRDVDRGELDEFMTRPNMAAACSLGISARARRVVIPPELGALPPARSLVQMRDVVRELFQVHSEASIAAGLESAWQFDPDEARRMRP